MSDLFIKKPVEIPATDRRTDLWLPKTVEEDLAQYADSKHERHAHGLIIVNGKEVGTTLRCPHCGGHFRSVKGSGHRRSFCTRHGLVTCGSDFCITNCVDAHPESLQGREL